MRSHIFVHLATTKYFSNSFVFKTEIEKEGLPGDITPALGAKGVTGTNPVAPTNTRTKFKREIGGLRFAQDFGSRLRRRESASSSNPVAPTINPMRFKLPVRAGE